MLPTGPSVQAEADERHEVSILYAEYARECAEVETLLVQNERVLQVAVTVVGGVAYAGVAREDLLLVNLVPFAVAGLLLYTANVHEFAMIGRGHAASLERRVNMALGRHVLAWERSVAGSVTHFRGTTMCLIVLGVLVQLGIASYAVAVTWPVRPAWVIVLATAAWAVPFAVAVVALAGLGRLRDRTTRSCDEAYEALDGEDVRASIRT